MSNLGVSSSSRKSKNVCHTFVTILKNLLVFSFLLILIERFYYFLFLKMSLIATLLLGRIFVILIFFDHLFVNEEIMIMQLLIGGDIKNGWVKILKGWSSDPLVFNTYCCPFSAAVSRNRRWKQEASINYLIGFQLSPEVRRFPILDLKYALHHKRKFKILGYNMLTTKICVVYSS